MSFLHTEYAWAFLSLCIAIIIMVLGYRQRKRNLKHFIHPRHWSYLLPGRDMNRTFYKRCMILAALTLIIIAFMRPQYGHKVKPIKRQGHDVFIALDTSLSMAVKDVSPNRFEKAKALTLALIDTFSGDRVGLMAFAGNAHIHCPLTFDYSALALFLKDMSIGMVSMAGTRIESPIFLAKTALGNRKNGILIIITDGENEDPSLKQSIRAMKTRGIRVYTIGVGTSKGDPIPVYNDNSQLTGYKRDKANNIVLSKLNEPLLQELSMGTGGRYASLKSDSWPVDALYKSISRLEKQQLEATVNYDKYEGYFIFLGIAALLLLIELCWSESRRSV